MSVENKVIIVTGAARGIGQEYVTALGAAGAKLVGGDINDCEETRSLMEAAGIPAAFARLDVTDADSCAALAKLALDTFGRIDGIVNNAALYGGLRGGRFDTIAEADWDASMNVNVKGIWNCCKAVVPAMRQTGGGSIVNIASLAGSYGTPFVLHYTTSKAAVFGLTRGLARELGRDLIRVNAVSPSAVLTEATREFFAEKADRALDVIKAGQAIPSNLNPADLVGTVKWLISDDSRFVTGQNIAVDGGTMMN